MFVTEKMNETNVEGIAELEKENFSDGWSLKSLKEEINNPDACYYTGPLWASRILWLG